MTKLRQKVKWTLKEYIYYNYHINLLKIFTFMKAKMTKKVVLKEELPSWNLSIAYYNGLDDPEIEADIEKAKANIKAIARFENKLEGLAPYEFEMFVVLYEGLIRKITKLYRFAHLYADTQKTDEKANSFASKLDAELEEELDKIHFIYYELASFSWDKRIELLNSPKLRKYVPWMMRVFASELPAEAAYIYDALDLIQEKKSATDGDWGDLYDKICSAMVFKVRGKTYNESEIRALRDNTHDPALYEAADKELQRVYKEKSLEITSIFNSILKNEDVEAKLNGYYNAEQASCTGNVVPREHLLELVSAVCDSFYPISRKFYALMDKLHKSGKCYPVGNPIKITHKTYTWNECVETVLNAFECFSENYAATARSIVEAGVIDVGPKPGKKSGGYCTQGEIPYIFLNFTGTEDDVNTFAHELGHGVNHVAAATQGILNDRTPISLAEVASEFAEFLLFNYQSLNAIKANDEHMMLYLTVERMYRMIGTIQRQIALYNFEKRAHKERQDGVLSTERLAEIWAEEYERYTGIKIEGDKRNEWMYVSHFFECPFYVYCYAFAGFIVNNLIKVYSDDDLERNEIFDFAERFNRFLYNTGVEFYPDLLEAFEIDVNDPEFWKNGTECMKEYLEFIEEQVEEEGLLKEDPVPETAS